MASEVQLVGDVVNEPLCIFDACSLVENAEIIIPAKGSSEKDKKCPLCHKTFRELRRHLKNKHKMQGSRLPDRISCDEPRCKFRCKHTNELNEHLVNEHQLQQYKYLEKKFDNVEEFQKWKSVIEHETVSQYVVKKGPQLTKKGATKHLYYTCNRSGKYRCQSKGKRQLKTKGSQKIGKTCTSQIRLTIESCGKCFITYCLGHYGHETSLEHIQVSKSDKDFIAERLLRGVTAEQILEEIGAGEGSKTERIHLVGKKDIFNIKRALQRKEVNWKDKPLETLHKIMFLIKDVDMNEEAAKEMFGLISDVHTRLREIILRNAHKKFQDDIPRLDISAPSPLKKRRKDNATNVPQHVEKSKVPQIIELSEVPQAVDDSDVEESALFVTFDIDNHNYC